MSTRISYVTNDGVRIVGDYYESPHSTRAVLLLHMMPATRESWQVFAEQLVEHGYNVLAIDERGHGESVVTESHRAITYHEFSDEEQQNKIQDVIGAMGWLHEKAIPAKHIAIGGASIGANLALQYVAMHHEIPKVFLLSPGLDYHGVKTEQLVHQLGAEQSALFVAAQDDPYAFKSIQTLYNDAASKKDKIEFTTGGHGTNLFEAHPDLMDDVIAFLE